MCVCVCVCVCVCFILSNFSPVNLILYSAFYLFFLYFYLFIHLFIYLSIFDLFLFMFHSVILINGGFCFYSLFLFSLFGLRPEMMNMTVDIFFLRKEILPLLTRPPFSSGDYLVLMGEFMQTFKLIKYYDDYNFSHSRMKERLARISLNVPIWWFSFSLEKSILA